MKKAFSILKLNLGSKFIYFYNTKKTPPLIGGVFFICCLLVFIIFRVFHKPQSIHLNETALVLDIAKSEQESLPLFYNLNGLTKASTSVLLKTEISGHIDSIFVKSGSIIEKGAPILKIDDLDVRAQTEAAKARVKEKELEYNAVEKLSKKGVRTVIEAERSKAELESARANLAKLEEAIIRAPDDGFIDYIAVDEGELLQSQAVVTKFLKLNPIKIMCYVSEKARPNIEEGLKVNIYFPSIDYKCKGRIAFVSKTAELKTKVYFVEIEADNKEMKILEGMQCQVQVVSPTQMRHRIPLSTLTLDDKGTPGIKFVTKEQKIKFKPITIDQIQEDKIIIPATESEFYYVRLGGDFIAEEKKVNIKTGQLIE